MSLPDKQQSKRTKQRRVDISGFCFMDYFAWRTNYFLVCIHHFISIRLDFNQKKPLCGFYKSKEPQKQTK